MRWIWVVACIGCSPDPNPVVDSAPASCSDGFQNVDETDVDCGGGCGPCADGKVCTKAHDCANSSCFQDRCAERMWFAESTGANVAVPGNQQWIAAPGANVTFTLLAPALVQLRWTGTSRFVGGANDVCHLGQRFVIDGSPTGHVTWGDAIMVQRGSTRWHEPFDVEIVVPLSAGSHTVSTEMTNANGYSTCNLDGDAGNPYDRSRLSVVAYDARTSWYAESTASTGALGGGSAWVDIPGAEVTISVSDASLVQVSLLGTQLAQGTAQGHCAYRLVLDDTPLGDANHGQAIAVGDVGGGWWAPVGINWGSALNAGTYRIRAQLRNSAALGGTCEAGQGNNPYARFHLFATTTEPGISRALESTGGPQIFGATSSWATISGLDTSLDVVEKTARVQLDVMGTQRTISGSGHCAYRVVVDGTPLGNATHGQAINVGEAAQTWWTHVGLLWSTTLDKGPHSLRVEARNSSSTGDCGVNGDGLPYGRTRMLVRAL